MRLLLLALAACSGAAARQPVAPALRVLWQVKVDVPSALKFNMETVDGALLDSGPRPEIYFREGLHAPTSGARVALALGPVATSTRLVGADNRGAWQLTRANGRQIKVSLDVIPPEAEWFDVDGKLFAVSDATRFSQVSDDGTVVWSARVPAVRGSARFLGTTRGQALFQLRRSNGSTVVAVDFTARTAKVSFEAQAGRGILAARTNQLAIMGDDRFEVFDLVDGARLRSVALPPFSARTAYSDKADLGFDGGVIWSYVYVPPSNGSIVISGQLCGYDVFDATSGRLLRTLVDASGEWKQLAEGCAVRALLPHPDGAIAVRVDGPNSATIIKLNDAP